jgi:hypothetical protein
MVGIPDGLGVLRKGKTAHVFMTHEIPKSAVGDLSEPRVGRPKQRGAFASEWILNKKGEVISGRRAYDTVYQDNTLVGPAAAADNSTPAFSRWCSAFLATSRVGFDRPIFLANEETGPPSTGPTVTFDPKGSQSVAIFDNQAHALSKLGHFPKENTIVMRGTGNRTIILTKEIQNADTLTDVQTEAAADARAHSASCASRTASSSPTRSASSARHHGRPAGPRRVGPDDQRARQAVPAALRWARPAEGRHPDAGVQRRPAGRGRGRPAQPGQPDRHKALPPHNEDGTGGGAPGGTGSRDDMAARTRDGSIWKVPLASAGDPSTFTRVGVLVGLTERAAATASRPTRASGRPAGSLERSTRSARTRSSSTCRRIRPRRRRAARP